jgi:hypothetical protein
MAFTPFGFLNQLDQSVMIGDKDFQKQRLDTIAVYRGSKLPKRYRDM